MDLLTNKNLLKMERTKNGFGRKVINFIFNSLSKKELQNVCGSGTMCFDTKTNTLYYVPAKPVKKTA